jgi:serine phosphatase RsbU (regulator of sigma subunit)/anti-sigma regulatory factor (Ser/Thr protein kinase)
MMEDGIHQQEAREQPLSAEEAVARLDDVHRLTEASLAYLNLEDLLAELLNRVTDILQADTAAILLLEEDGRTLAARAAKGLEEEVERGFRLPIGRGFAGRIAATREPVMIADLGDSTLQPVNPLFREKGVRSLLGVPLVVDGEVVGVLHVGSLTSREFRATDAELLQIVGDRVALEIERSRLEVQDRIAQTLQRSLLPRSLPRLPGLRLAARYLPASHESALGGDWYDVIELGPRRLGLAIGDVAGHGMAAATYMGQLRSATRAYAREVERPGELLTKVARFAEGEESRMATMIYATLDLDTWKIDYARAGHPYPLVLRRDGSAEFHSAAQGPPLGAGKIGSYAEQSIQLKPGETVILYTDGLIERRGQRLTEGEEALANAAIAAPDEPELLCRAVIAALTDEGDIPDDIAMLAIQVIGLHELLEVEMPAQDDLLSTTRNLVRRWVSANGGTDDDCAAFAIAVTEACANAVEHAYGPDDEMIELRARLAGDDAHVTIRDRGRWREKRRRNRGRGIAVMREFMDDVEITRGAEGTTVELRRRIGGRSR